MSRTGLDASAIKGIKISSTAPTNGQVYSYNSTTNLWEAGTPSSVAYTIGTIDSQTAATNGAVITGSSLVMQSASATKPGLVNNTSQVFSGAKAVINTGTTTGEDGVNFNSQLIINFPTDDTANVYVSEYPALLITDNQNHPNGIYAAINAVAELQGSGTVASLIGISGDVINSDTGVITEASAFIAQTENTGGGTITTAYGYRVLALDGTTKYGFSNDIAGSLDRFMNSGFGIAPVATARAKFGASTTGIASFNLPTGVAPTSPVDGDVWREDNTNTGLKIRVNGVTKTITLS